MDKILKATHEGALKIGKTTIPCAVLENGTRLLSQPDVLAAFGRSKKPKGRGSVKTDGLPAVLSAANLKPFITNELATSTASVPYINLRGRKVLGFDAKLLPMICEVYFGLP